MTDIVTKKQNETQNNSQPHVDKNYGNRVVSVPQGVIVANKKNGDSEQEKEYRITKQFEDWLKAFLDKKSHTYGNATQSAIVAYNLDPETQYNHASVMGHKNLRKAKELKAMYAESRGLSIGKLVDVQISRSLDTQNPRQKDWFDDLMIDLGYRDPRGAQVLVQNNTQVNNVDINAPEVQDWNKKFEKFLSSQ